MEKRTHPIYLDNHATTKVDPRVLEAMMPFFSDSFGNASSIDHIYGNEAASAVKTAREKVANLINSKDPDDIIFTSGATESDNMAILGVARALKNKGNHIITVRTEHKAVLESCNRLEKEGFQITYLPVDYNGCIKFEDLKKAIKKDTILITIMAANNEVGTIAPLKAIGEFAKENNIIFHTDAAQAFGHIPIDVIDMKIDLLSISGHKIYGPKGIGALYINQDNMKLKIDPLMFGGGQEFGYRPGTYNTPGIVGLGKAAELAKIEMTEESKRLSKLRDMLYRQISSQLPVEINGNAKEKLSHNLNLYFPGIEGKALINEAKGIAISAGSACTSKEVKPSHVLTAMGFDNDRIHSSIRIGLGRFTTKEEISLAVKEIVKAVLKLKRV